MARIHLIYDPKALISHPIEIQRDLKLKVAVMDVREDFLTWPPDEQVSFLLDLCTLLFAANREQT